MIENNNRELKETTLDGEIAKFYGFKLVLPPNISKQDLDVIKNFNQSNSPEELSSILRIYFEEKMMSIPQPVMMYCSKPFIYPKKDHIQKKKNVLEKALITLGSPKYVSECISIQAAISILNYLGYKDLEIHINSVGDKESSSDFIKKINLFIKKNFSSFPSDLKQEIKKDPFVILKKHKEEWKKFVEECPKSIDFLSEKSRLHFKDILEFFETMNIPYTIDNNLLGNMDTGSETFFSIINTDKDEEVAYGFRFNRLAKKIGLKKDISSCILSINAKINKKLKVTKIKNTKTDFCLVQFGNEARLKSFLILKELYKAGINIKHSIDKDKLGDQIYIAEKSGSKYIILVGQKEAINNSVIIRNIGTRAQESVPIQNLINKIKELKK